MPSLKANRILKTDGLKIAKLLQRGGFQAFWVGGTVRNMLLGKPVDNVDIATDARPADVERALIAAGYRPKPVGRAYGTVLAAGRGGPVEITTFRREARYADRRRPQEVVFVDSLEEDSSRRDLTVNAMYFDPTSGALLDPQDGRKDLEAGLARFVGDPRRRIDEDALRTIRAARLCAQLGFRLERNSFAAIKTRAKYIQGVSGERIKSELDKILLLPNRADGVRLLDDLGLLRFMMPEVTALKEVWHGSRTMHLEGSAFEHTMLALGELRRASLPLAYATLYHDTGKATVAISKSTGGESRDSYPGHEVASAAMAAEMARRLKFSRSERQATLWITKMHMMRLPFTQDMGEAKKIRLATHPLFPELAELWRADALANTILSAGERVREKPTAYAAAMKLHAKISDYSALLEKFCGGDFIMRATNLPPGPRVGAVKERLRAEIISRRVKNLRDAKNFLAKFRA